MENQDFFKKAAAADARKSKERDYWLERLAGEPVRTGFPYDSRKTGPGAVDIKQESVEFSPGTLQRLIKLSSGTNTKLFIILLAALAVLLERYTGREDIVITVPITRQTGRDESSLINTVLPIRLPLAADTSFKELLMQARQALIAAGEHQNFPLETLVDVSLFDTALVLENIQDRNYLRHLQVSVLFSFLKTGDAIAGSLEYDAASYRRDTARRLVDHFKKILHEALINPALPVARLEILSGEEKKRILCDFNDTAADYPAGKTLHELFEEQAEKTPDRIAVFGRAHELHEFHEFYHMSYGELNQGANRLAGTLRKRGIQANDIVAVMAERSVETIAGILGILKAGAAYLPIDPGFPRERIDYMLTDSRASLLLTKEDTGFTGREGGQENFTGKNDRVTGDLAYIIYTSGSTGKPKGVLISHGNVVPVVKNCGYIEITSSDRVLQLSNIAFDGSVFDIFAALLNGAVSVMSGWEEALDVQRLGEFIKREQVTVFFVTTAMFNTLVDVHLESLKGVRKILFGGERVSVSHARRALSYLGKGRLLHMYGPTETTVFASCYAIDEIDDAIPIGKPLSNTVISIIDRLMQPVPTGAGGELLIGGPGVSPGYLNNPGLTGEKFVSISYKSYRSYGSYRTYISKKTYKTGDLARWLPDGNLEFLGRMDHQVKIRGFRIELGEIEHYLLKSNAIEEAVVLVRADKSGDRYLAAYIAPRGCNGDRPGAAELKEFLAHSLPAYMIPAYFVFIDRMPLTANGKIDRAALPDPSSSAASRNEYIEPRDEIEKKLAAIWSEVLGDTKPIGIDDDFFQLGGHSLKATIMTTQIHRQLLVKIPLETVFAAPTIRELAEYARKSSREEFQRIPLAEQKEYYPLSSAQKRLYIMQHMGVDYISYNQFMVLVLAGGARTERLERTFGQLIQRHESLRTSFEIIGDEPMQRIHDKVEFKIEYHDLAAADDEKLMIKNFVRPFDLSQAPLLRAALLEREEREYLLMLDMHHIISDGTTLGIFAREFIALYSGVELPGLRIQYKDFAQWQNSPAGAEEMKKQENYWLQCFSGDMPRLDLPLDYSRSAQQEDREARCFFEIDKELTGKLKLLAREINVTIYMALLAIYNIVLSKYTGRQDIVVGSGIAGRRHADLQDVMGMFVNMLPMRNYPQEDKPFIEFLNEVKENALKAYGNQDYPFDRLVEKLGVQREPGRNPIFDTQFTFQNLAASSAPGAGTGVETPGFTIRPYEGGAAERTMQFDLSLDGVEGAGSIMMTFQYSAALFKESTIQAMARHFNEILEQALQNRQILLKDIGISHDLQAGKTVLSEEDSLDYEF
jgi:amino acid adenylation domain-containing protein